MGDGGYGRDERSKQRTANREQRTENSEQVTANMENGDGGGRDLEPGTVNPAPSSVHFSVNSV